jgi:hypothetical protein
MIIVLADAADQPAQRIVARWSAHDAILMTPTDLSRPGWRLELGRPSRWTAVLGERRIGDADPLLGVLTCLAAVEPGALCGIVAEDRGYVAAEMTAFLVSWLTELRCTLVNRPSPGCLTGPGWRPQEWTRVAAELGIPVAAPTAERYGPPGTAPCVVTVAGSACLGAPSALLAERAHRLAGAAGLGLASVTFDASVAEAPFLAAWPGGDLDDPEVAAGLLAALQEPRLC